MGGRRRYKGTNPSWRRRGPGVRCAGCRESRRDTCTYIAQTPLGHTDMRSSLARQTRMFPGGFGGTRDTRPCRLYGRVACINILLSCYPVSTGTRKTACHASVIR